MSRAAAQVAFAFCVLAFALVAGCATPGEPSPRHPVIPSAVTDLAARQSGSAVVLAFSLPHESTDHEPLAEAPTIEVYRAALPPGATPGRKTAWRMVYTIPSERVDSYVNTDHVEFRDPLAPDNLGQSAGSPLTYMVRTRVVKSRGSGDSNLFTLRIYPPPAPPRDLRVSLTESAVALSWTEPLAADTAPKPVGYRVYRAEIEPGEESRPQEVPQVKLRSPLAMQGSNSSPEFSDSQFEFGHTYLYTVRAVAQYGADAIESADASPAVVAPRDTFPPATPVGLEAAIIPATPGAPAHVELSWAISSEGDLAGYHVYRSDLDNLTGERINREVLPSPTFRDTSVVSGKRYFYRVSAVDGAGNESPVSSLVQIEVP
jgi:hypothetical protein